MSDRQEGGAYALGPAEWCAEIEGAVMIFLLVLGSIVFLIAGLTAALGTLLWQRAIEKRLLGEAATWREEVERRLRIEICCEARRMKDIDVEEERRKVSDILKRFYKLNPSRIWADGGATYRVCVDFTRELILLSEHGRNDQMRYLARILADRIEQELVTLNLERFRDSEVEQRRNAAMRNQFIYRGDP